MKFIISESKIQSIALKWLNDKFDLKKLEKIELEEYPNSIFYKKNGVYLIEIDKTKGYIWFNNDHIWSFLKDILGIKKYEEIVLLLKLWLKEYQNMIGLEPRKASEYWPD